MAKDLRMVTCMKEEPLETFNTEYRSRSRLHCMLTLGFSRSSCAVYSYITQFYNELANNHYVTY